MLVFGIYRAPQGDLPDFSFSRRFPAQVSAGSRGAVQRATLRKQNGQFPLKPLPLAKRRTYVGVFHFAACESSKQAEQVCICRLSVFAFVLSFRTCTCQQALNLCVLLCRSWVQGLAYDDSRRNQQQSGSEAQCHSTVAKVASPADVRWRSGRQIGPAMCISKEAWEHFIFVPLPQSRITKASSHLAR